MTQFAAALTRWRATPLMTRALALAALVTVFLLGMVAFEQVRRDTGAEIVLLTRPVDPRDLIRGAYVALEYEVERVHLPDLPTPADPSDWREGDELFLGLHNDGTDIWKPVSLTRGKPQLAEGDVALRVKYVRREDFAAATEPGENMPVDILVDIGADRYFSDQTGATQLEKDAREGPLSIILSVAGDGKAVIKGLVINGQKRYETLM